MPVEVTPTPANEKLIVQYLLGHLPEKECVRIEDQAFQDEQYMQSILDVESDLIDEYVRGEFSPRERGLFESHFLASPERRRKVEFARALAKVIAPPAQPQVVWTRAKDNPFVAFLKQFGRPIPALSFALALILMMAVVWLVIDAGRLRAQLGEMRAEQQKQETRRQELEAQLTLERQHSEELASQLHQQPKNELPPDVPQPAPSPDSPTSPLTLALTLLPGGSRGGDASTKVEVNPQIATVNVGVVVDPQETLERFRVELRGPNGSSVWSSGNLRPRATRRGRVISLSLPANVLRAGRHELVLQGVDSGTTDVGYYYFEVTRKN